MFTCMRIADVGYYVAEADENAPQDHRMGYYAKDDGAGEDVGRWWAPMPGGVGAKPLVERDAVVDVTALRRLADGNHPVSGAPLIQRSRTERVAGYDLHFSAPKSVSVLYAVSGPATRARITAVLKRAVVKTLDSIAAMGLIETRVGKGGAVRVPVADCAVGRWLHTTARSGDPQLHVHAVLLNICRRPDGGTGTLDNLAILRHQRWIGAAFDAELSTLLAQELDLPIERVLETGSFEVSGVSKEVRRVFSKRREAIEAAAEAAGYDTADDRARAQRDALRTRTAKEQLPDQADLEARWRRELAACGWSGEGIRTAVDEARLDELLDGARDDAGPRERADRAADAAVDELEKSSSVLERRRLLTAVAQRMVGLGGIDVVLAAVDRMVADGRLVVIGRASPVDEPVYATPTAIAREAAMLRIAMARRGEGAFVPAAATEAAIAARVGITEEQATAVRHALGPDGVTVLEGPPGAGKSYMSEPIAAAARACGKRVFVVSTSWRATDVIREETATPEEDAKCAAAFLARLNPHHPDHIALDKDAMVIVDEGSMLDTAAMADLLAKANGARVIVIGDTRQLSAVGAGSPMALLARPGVLGTQRLQTIRRQVEDWQRQASMAFSRGDHAEAVRAYDERGHVHWLDGRDACLDRLAADWAADLAANPAGERLCMAYRHADVRDINARCRAAYQAASRLSGEDIVVSAIGRGRRARPEPLCLAVGDRVVFGENVTVGGVQIRNADLGTVEAIVRAAGTPALRVRLDKGAVAEGGWSDFVGRRPEGCRAEQQVPRLQHAYCLTVHSAQGLTVGSGNAACRVHGATFVYNAGLGAEAALVALTRHVDTCTMYVETGRVRDRILGARSAHMVGIDRAGRLDAPDGGETDQEAVSAEDIKAAVPQVKSNVTDYLSGVDRWMAGRQELTPSRVTWENVPWQGADAVPAGKPQRSPARRVAALAGRPQ